MHMIKFKCMPILLYGSDVCDFSNATMQSLDFSVIRFGMKLFKTSNRNTVLDIFDNMCFKIPSLCIPLRVHRFESMIVTVNNRFCRGLCPVL